MGTKKGQMVGGVGYFSKSGVIKYRAKDINDRITVCYSKWVGMLTRCYSEKSLHKNPTYIGCVVSDDWLDFQVFAEWFYSHRIVNSRIKFDLDKDLLIKDNKIYSKETCSLLPAEIHNHISTNKKNKNTNLPKGVVWVPDRNKYRVVCSVGGNVAHKGIFSSLEEALECYLKVKTDYAKILIERYKLYLNELQISALLDINTYS